MVDIGRDGTITVQKLEGSEMHFHAKSSHFMASKVPSSNVMKPTTASYGGRIRAFGVAWAYPIFPFHLCTYCSTDSRFPAPLPSPRGLISPKLSLESHRFTKRFRRTIAHVVIFLGICTFPPGATFKRHRRVADTICVRPDPLHRNRKPLRILSDHSQGDRRR
jgi:hypothetical protein